MQDFLIVCEKTVIVIAFPEITGVIMHSFTIDSLAKSLDVYL